MNLLLLKFASIEDSAVFLGPGACMGQRYKINVDVLRPQTSLSVCCAGPGLRERGLKGRGIMRQIVMSTEIISLF